MACRDLVIIGASGNGREMLDAIASGSPGNGVEYRAVGILDDKKELWGSTVKGVTVLGGLELAQRMGDVVFVNAIGGVNTHTRKPALIENLGLPAERFATIIHRSAVVSPDARVGAGSVVLANTVIGSDAWIGHHVLMLPNVVVSHDVRIDDYAILASGVCLAGYVHLGRAAYVGTNAAVRDRVKVGSESLVGMGAVVLNDVAPRTTVAGVPAKEMAPASHR